MTAITWKEIDALCKQGRNVYEWCWVCGEPLGPDRIHIVIDNGRVMRHTYCCRRHRYVAVTVRGMDAVLQERSDLEIEALAWAFKDGALAPGWE